MRTRHKTCVNDRGRRTRLALSVFSASIIAVLSAGFIFTHSARSQSALEKKPPAHVSSAACAECHQKEHSLWSNSHHSWAMRLPTQDNVLGNFDDAIFKHKGIRSRFFRRNGRFFIETDGHGGKHAEFEIKYTVGVAPLQQYLVELDKGRLQALDIAWDTVQKRWFHLYPDQKLKPGYGLHWSGPYKNWQARCAECHQTNFVKGYVPKARSYQSRWSELTVGCESCHGPGGAHVAWAKDPVSFASQRRRGFNELGLTVAFVEKAAETEIQICAPCHSRRGTFGADSPPPGSRFSDHYRLALLREGLYYPDGQIDGEVYVYGSFLQSKMYARGVRCSNCHEPHTGALRADGNAVCTQCHGPAGNADFPILQKTAYDDPSHHHHEEGSAGAKCVNCHMPSKTYMRVDPRRDHSFRVPRPDLTEKIGTPNACTGCHEEKTAQWATARLKKWFPAGRSGQPHYGLALHAGRKHTTPQAAQRLLDLALDASQPAIVRASALDLLRRSMRPTLLERATPLLKDKSDLIRTATLRLYQAAPPRLRVKTATSVLNDPVRSVRTEAAKLLIGLPLDALSDSDQRVARRAIAAYQSSLFARADYPETQMQIAGLAMALRNFNAAQGALKEALSMDPQLADAWVTLAQIQSALRHPDQAIETLESAAQAIPDNGNIFLQLGSLHMQLRRHGRAVEALEKALELTGPSPELLDMLAVSQMGAGNLEKAREYADQLVKGYPNHRPSALVGQLKKMPK